MTRFPRATSLLAVACLAGTACSADDAGHADGDRDAGVGDLRRPTGGVAAPAGTAWPADGTGAGPGARYDPAADRTVVATTIGVSVLHGDDEPVVLREGLPVLLALSADGTLAPFTTADGALEVWDLDAAAAVATFDVPADRYTSLQFSSPDDLVAGGDRWTSAASRSTGAPPEALVEAPADGTLGPVAIAADGAVAVPVGGPRPSVEVWRPAGGAAAGPVDMGLADGTARRRRRVVARRTAPRRAPPTAGRR